MQVINDQYEAASVYWPAQLWFCWKVIRVLTGSTRLIFITIYIRLAVTASIKQPLLRAITAFWESNITSSHDRDDLHTCKTNPLDVLTHQSNEINFSKVVVIQGHTNMYIFKLHFSVTFSIELVKNRLSNVLYMFMDTFPSLNLCKPLNYKLKCYGHELCVSNLAARITSFWGILRSDVPKVS
jgi:hypothetical protein